MRRMVGLLVMLAMVLVSGPAPCWASPHGRETPEAAALPPMNDQEKQGFGCMAVGSAATATTMFAGPNEVVMIIAGGTIPAATPVVLVVAVLGTVFASFCAVGTILTPATLRTLQNFGIGLPQE